MSLKKVAFVVMPFGTKSTGLTADKGPTSVDFDALWNCALYPALEKMQYMPIRADNQTGSVIVKDMLEMLVHADLVVADISIPNGNVYYETGVRHAARDKGCVMLAADWSRPLFDLAQITHIKYPSAGKRPSERSYKKIVDFLVENIPALVESVGPVTELATGKGAKSAGSRHLKETSEAIFDFQTKLETAKHEAKRNNKGPLRELLNDDNLTKLPTYAITELVEAARDNLNWDELIALLNRLPEKLLTEPYFLEQKAIASGRKGRLSEAIALLEQITDKYGETAERLGTIGSRYRELARSEKQKGRKTQLFAKTIKYYQRGMTLDLNDYYCAYKLVSTLLERGRPGDREEALRYAEHVLYACQRAEELGLEDEWVDPSLLMYASIKGDLELARKLGNSLVEREWATWKLGSVVKDLEQVIAASSQKLQKPLRAILEDLTSILPVSQEELMGEVLPLIKSEGERYRKSVKVDARPAVEGEIIVSVTKDGEETSQAAREKQMVVRNMTDAREEYLVNLDKFKSLYGNPESIKGETGWKRYSAKGKIMAIQVLPEVTTLLNVGSEFYIKAPWGTEQIVKEDDYFVTPLPGQDEIYRIAEEEFLQTYALMKE